MYGIRFRVVSPYLSSHKLDLTRSFSEFNYYRDKSGKCVLVDGAVALSSNTESEQCLSYNDEFWYERTAYRKIPYSSCVGGERLDHGPQHECPGLVGGGLSGIFWGSVAILPFAIAGLAGWWWYSKGGTAGYVFISPLSLINLSRQFKRDP